MVDELISDCAKFEERWVAQQRVFHIKNWTNVQGDYGTRFETRRLRTGRTSTFGFASFRTPCGPKNLICLNPITFAG